MKTFAKPFLFLLIVFAAAGCGGHGGWPKDVKDTVIGGCIKEAKSRSPELDDTKLKNYCACYQENLQKRFPDVAEMKNMNAQDLTVEAQKCMELMFQ